MDTVTQVSLKAGPVIATIRPGAGRRRPDTSDRSYQAATWRAVTAPPHRKQNKGQQNCTVKLKWLLSGRDRTVPPHEDASSPQFPSCNRTPVKWGSLQIFHQLCFSSAERWSVLCTQILSLNWIFLPKNAFRNILQLFSCNCGCSRTRAATILFPALWKQGSDDWIWSMMVVWTVFRHIVVCQLFTCNLIVFVTRRPS